jgi:hypothetical protein
MVHPPGVVERTSRRHRCHVDGWQVLHLLLGDAEVDSVIHANHGTNRYCDFLASPKMALLEQQMGYAAMECDERFHLSDNTIGRVYLLPASHVHLTPMGRCRS